MEIPLHLHRLPKLMQYIFIVYAEIECLSLWEYKTLGSFFFQALYFSYGFGAFVSPLIAEPFLSGTPHPDLGLPAARRGNPLPYGGMGHRSHHKLSHRPTNHLRDKYYPGSEQYKSEVQVAYWIIALAHVSFFNA